ncbi:TolC family protein [Bacteroidota bacterium]
MKKTFFTTISLLVFLITVVNAQNTEEVLKIIASNNKEIIANQELFKSLVMEYKTGITPSDPRFEYGYYPGNTVAPGAKRTVGLTQSFDFPTSYKHMRKYSDKQVMIAESRLKLLNQDVLLEAKITIINLVYFMQYGLELERRKSMAKSLFESINKKFENGNASILDLNKAKTGLLNANNDLLLNNSEIKQNAEKLCNLNGGIEINISRAFYPEEKLPGLQQTIDEALSKDPGFFVSKLENEAADQNIKLQKSLALPKLEIGYGSETVVDESFIGGKFGMSFPLWEKKNTVKYAKTYAGYTSSVIETYKIGFVSGIKQHFINAEALKNAYNDYNNLVLELKSEELLNKALDLGHISLIEYLLELSFYYNTVDTMMELEKKYYKALAELFKYNL